MLVDTAVMDEVEEWWLAVTEHMPVEERVELLGMLASGYDESAPPPGEG